MSFSNATMSAQLRSWLEQLGVGQYAQVFCDNDVDLDVLPDLTDEDLKELGVSLGHRKRLLKAISVLTSASVAATEDGTSPGFICADPRDRAERRQLTVMFCDLVGSTALSVRFDPEDLRDIMVAYRSCCEPIVARFGGNVAQYMGDGLLVYFGYPRADEHDPERAVRSGLEIATAVQALDVRPGLTLHARVGIATGEVVVGDLIGQGATQERTVVGETPNLAARLQTLAKPDSVVISTTTRRLVGGLFEYADLGVRALKGFRIPMPAWRVTCERVCESRFEAIHGSAELTPLVGRKKELEALWQRWKLARDGHGQLVVLRGEAGIGKSRLTHALREQLRSDRHALLCYFCVPYHQNSAFFPVTAQLERAAAITRDDTPATKLDKLETLLGQAAQDVSEVAPLFAALLSIPCEDRYRPLNLSPQRQKENTLAALKEQLAGFARRRPLLMVFEDLHWADPTTLEFLEGALERIRRLPVLMLMTSRPQFRAPWPEGPHVTTLTLNRLDHHQGAAIAAGVTGGRPIPPTVLEQILAKADGVPLFVEELTKTMLDLNALNEDEAAQALSAPLPPPTVPSTLQDSLMARLDRLSGVKEVAQVGAVIGRRFSYEMLTAVSRFKEPVLSNAVGELAAAELVGCEGTSPHATYTFKHALIQDAAYSSLLRSTRQRLHARIARVLERRFPEKASREPELLAHHFTRAGDTLQAISYWHQAGTRASERAAHKEALKHFNAALSLLAVLPEDTTRHQIELGLRVSLGLSLESTRGYAAAEVEENYHRARMLCQQLGQSADLVPVLLGLIAFHIVRDELPLARELAQQSVQLARESERPRYLIEAYTALGYALCYMGKLEGARATLEQSLELYAAHGGGARGFVTAQDPAVACYSLLGIVLWLLGYPDQALQAIQNGFALADELDKPFNVAFVYAHAAQLHQLRGEPEKAAMYAEQGIEIASRYGYDIWLFAGRMHLAIARGVLGQADESVSAVGQALAAWRDGGAELNRPYFLAGMARAQQAAGRVEEARRLVAEALECAERTGEQYHVALLHHLQGQFELAASVPDPRAAEAHFIGAMGTARSQSARLLELRATTALHRLHVDQGRGVKSRAELVRLYASFTEGLHTSDLREAAALLSEPL
jgi:class 3 adenylate cyclase/predicted ATPase